MAIVQLINSIRFEKASPQYQAIIFAWLAEPHIQEFWDNSQEHKDDINNFIQGRPQQYFYGTTKYWLGFVDAEPFCFILSDKLLAEQKNLSNLHKQYLSKTGNTISLDFGIGNKTYLGKGLAAPTLKAFTEFYKTQVDPFTDTFFIDPDENNPRAAHVYVKAGFKQVGEFKMKQGVFTGQKTLLLVKTL